jgi:transposase
MTVNAGVDLHKTQFTVYMPKNGKPGFKKYAASEAVRAGLESIGNTRYFKKVMEEAGVGVTVITSLKFKVVNEPVKKTDKHDAAMLAEFLEKDILPEGRLCSEASEQLRRLLKVRTTLVRSLQSKKGRRRVLDALNERESGLVVRICVYPTPTTAARPCRFSLPEFVLCATTPYRPL